MERVRMPHSVFSGILMLSAFFFLLNGCSGQAAGAGNSSPDDRGFAPPIYYDFEDVRLPEELKVDNSSSFVYRTAGISAGVLVLEGRVELYSLTGFFEKSMAQADWKYISYFNASSGSWVKSPRRMMLFQKENRWCVINITEGKIKTQVEVWVSPTMNSTGSILMK